MLLDHFHTKYVVNAICTNAIKNQKLAINSQLEVLQFKKYLGIFYFIRIHKMDLQGGPFKGYSNHEKYKILGVRS